MHDPCTMAWQIKWPWKRKTGIPGFAYRDPLLTVWHVDPEKDGSDDSCGFTFARPTAADCSWCDKEARREWDFWFGPEYGGLRDADDLSVLTRAWKHCRERAGNVSRWKPLRNWELNEVLGLLDNPADNFAHAVRRARDEPEGLGSLLWLTLRVYRTRTRPWYRHPRWHFWHWKIVLHPLQNFRLWLTRRCAACGRRFGWHEAAIAEGSGLYHWDCSRGKPALGESGRPEP